MEQAWARVTGRPSVGDVALAVVLAGAAVVESLFAPAPHPALRALVAALGVLALVARVAHPVGVCAWLAVALVLESVVLETPDEVGVLLAILVLAYTVFAHAPVPRALPGAALLGGVVRGGGGARSLGLARRRPPDGPALRHGPGIPRWVVRRRTHRIEELERERAVLAEELERVAADERARIARELHDVVSHAVTLIAVQSEAGAARLPADPAAAARSLEAIGVVSRDALAELHCMLGLLDAGPRAPGPSTSRALSPGPARPDSTSRRGLVAGLSPRGGARCLRLPGGPGEVTNALRHSATTRASAPRHSPDGTAMSVTSGGYRTAVDVRRNRAGPRGVPLTDRVLWGTLQTSAEEEGFTVTAWVPSGTGAVIRVLVVDDEALVRDGLVAIV